MTEVRICVSVDAGNVISSVSVDAGNVTAGAVTVTVLGRQLKGKVEVIT
jgi:hypothetical protein